jgi:hypothetical protein
MNFSYPHLQNIDEFFNQWIYGAGHPEPSIVHSIDQFNKKITQRQQSTGQFELKDFNFPLDIKLVFSIGNNASKKTEIHQIEISKKETEVTLQLPIDDRGQKGKLEWFSIDPKFKILNEIMYIDSSKEMLLKQLLEGETVYERIQAIEALPTMVFVLANFQTMTT